MGGDYTRWTFDPTKDYKSLFKQQGRVDLDADWNELVEITDRHWRTETIDLGGQDFVAATTPNAFLITPVGPNDFNIGIGRLYVDGLVAECHGLPPAKFDPILGEIQETNPVLYSNQPYLPSPLPPAIGAPNTTDLIYLDVWEREVTAIQDPNIREKALAGPDTCTRLQTVWQVKDLPNVGQHGCQDDIPAYDAIIAPSAGRLTTSTIPPNPSATPCILSQTGGYTGLENRLYRVEVHVAGTVDGANPAQFKWSRDNGSVVAGVTAISASSGTNSLLNVTTLGRDSVLRFNSGDWVEVLDDYTEFAGIAGHLAKIVSPPDAANLTLTVNPPVPAAFNFNPADPTRHTRVRRWDGRADLNSDVNAATGLIPVSAALTDIEQGIQVSFSADPVGGTLKVGDYWIFAARTFDASVEPLVNAPPRGILHHYCRLGYITWAAAGAGSGTFSDCRPKGQECTCGGECSATVGDGVDSTGQFTDIQKAIDSLGPAGGVVCVGRGVYVVTNTIVIDPSKGHVTLRGMGAATRIIFAPGEGSSSILLRISQTDHIVVDGFFMAAVSAGALIEIAACSFCAVRNCTLVNLNIEAATGFNFASAAAVGGGQSARAISMAGQCIGCDIEENALLAAKGIFATSVENLRVRDNDFLSFHGAVFLNTGNGLEIQYNLMRGLDQAAFKKLQGIAGGAGLSRDNINAVQTAVNGMFAAPQGSEFMGTGVFLVSGFDVNISHNRIAAQAAIVSFLLIEASFEANEILAFIGFLSLFGIIVRVANNLIAGLLLGFTQVGIIIDLVCESNFWLGFLGITFLPLFDFLSGAGSTLATGLQKANIAANGNNVMSSGQQAGATVGTLRSFGLAATVKIHGNDFLTFLYGVAKFGQFLSADFSILDNTFTVCAATGVYLGAQLGEVGSEYLKATPSTFASGIAKFFNLRHLIQGNAFVVSGIGIYTRCPRTFIRDNSITCSTVGVELLGENCDVENNDISGDPAKNSVSSGLIQLQLRANGARISGNRLADGPGNGIALIADASGATIDDNEIKNMKQNGISSTDGLASFEGLSVTRNIISDCAGGVAGSAFWHGGGIILPMVQDVQIIGNKVTGNGTVALPEAVHGIYLDTVTGADISDNSITGNVVSAPSAGWPSGGIAAPFAMGEVLVHGNRIRGNGGRAIDVQDFDQSGSISIQKNYVDNTAAAASNPDVYLIHATGQSFLHLEDNICLFTVGPNATFARAVVLTSINGHILVNGNTVQMTAPQAQGGGIWTLEVDSLGQTAIVTSNLLTGGPNFLFSGNPLAANNLGI